MRACPFAGCGNIIAPDMFACKPHWFSLSSSQRVRIWKCWDSFTAGTIGIEELRRIQGEVLAEAQPAEKRGA